MRQIALGFVVAAVLGLGFGCNSEASKPGDTVAPPGADTSKMSSTTSAPATSGQAAPADKGKAEVGKEVVTPSGLHYIDVKIGTGPTPQQGQMVQVHYTG